MIYRKRSDNKMSFKREWHVFTDAAGAGINEFTETVYSKFTIEDFCYSDDWKFEVVRIYFNKVVVPHKISVYQAGIDLLRNDWVKELNFDKDQFVDNLIWHDISKFSANEAFGYAFHNFETGKDSYPGFSLDTAWNHHKNHNPHHPEYWLSVDRSGNIEALKMPDIYVLEMVADWIGAGTIYGNSLEKWLPSNIERFALNHGTAKTLQTVLSGIGISTDIYTPMGGNFSHLRMK